MIAWFFPPGFDWIYFLAMMAALAWAMIIGFFIGMGATLEYRRREAVRFIQIIEHGDEAHKTWLWNAAIDFWKIERPAKGLTELP